MYHSCFDPSITLVGSLSPRLTSPLSSEVSQLVSCSLPLNPGLKSHNVSPNRPHSAGKQTEAHGEESLPGISPKCLLPAYAFVAFPISLWLWFWPCNTQFWSLHSHLKVDQERRMLWYTRSPLGFSFWLLQAVVSWATMTVKMRGQASVRVNLGCLKSFETVVFCFSLENKDWTLFPSPLFQCTETHHLDLRTMSE